MNINAFLLCLDISRNRGLTKFVSDSLMYNFERENPFIHARIITMVRQIGSRNLPGYWLGLCNILYRWGWIVEDSINNERTTNFQESSCHYFSLTPSNHHQIFSVCHVENDYLGSVLDFLKLSWSNQLWLVFGSCKLCETKLP